MYLDISLVLAVCVICLFIGLLYVQSGKKSLDTYCKKLKKDNDDTYKSCINLLEKKEKEINAAQNQARAFEQAAKTMEEHLAAERGRADRLAKALRMSEDARCELKQQLEKMRKQVNTTGSTILDEMKRRGEKPVFTAVMQRDLANIMAYNGTAQSQEVLTDE